MHHNLLQPTDTILSCQEPCEMLQHAHVASLLWAKLARKSPHHVTQFRGPELKIREPDIDKGLTLVTYAVLTCCLATAVGICCSLVWLQATRA